MRLYSAGPMTGLPEFNYPAFFDAAERLGATYEAVNPARHGIVAGWGWADYMREALRDVVSAEGVAVLPGWEASKGARLEVQVAEALGLPIKSVDDWLRVVA